MADRKVVTEFEVTKTGDTNAPGEIAADITQLDSAAAGAGDGLSDLSSGLDQVDSSGKGAAEALEGVGDATQKTSDVAGVGIAKALAYFQALETGWEIGTKLRTVLNDLSEGGFDRLVQSTLNVYPPTKALIDLFDGADAPIVEMTSELKLLKSAGIDPAGMSLEQIHIAAEKVMVSMGKMKEATIAANEAAKAQTAAYNAQLEKLGLSKPKLDEAAASWSSFVQRYTTENAGLSKLPAPLAAETQKMLDMFKRAGVEVPPELQKIATSFGILDTETKKWHDTAMKAATEVAQFLSQDLNKLSWADPEAYAAAKVRIEEMVTKFRMANVEISAELASAAAQVGVLVGEIETAGTTTETFAAGQKAVATSFRLVRDEMGNITGGVSDYAAAQDTAATNTEETTTGVDEQKTAAGKLITEIGGVRPALEEAFNPAGLVEPLEVAIDRLITKINAAKQAAIDFSNVDGGSTAKVA